jgi:biopolymer transport protein ExbB/TolQ
MDTVIFIIIVLVSFNFLLKLTNHSFTGVVLTALAAALFTGLMWGVAIEQSQIQIADWLIEADKNLSLSKILTKMGPILGLMGTLIPMGPALVGLASGDIASMAHNMQVAFATTVVGMVVSAIGFVTQQAKERWYVRDMATLDYIAQLMEESQRGE